MISLLQKRKRLQAWCLYTKLGCLSSGAHFCLQSACSRNFGQDPKEGVRGSVCCPLQAGVGMAMVHGWSRHGGLLFSSSSSSLTGTQSAEFVFLSFLFLPRTSQSHGGVFQKHFL